MEPVKWGVISTANIGVQRVLPPMIANPFCDVVAIASRDQAKAEAAAATLGIPRAYGSYEALLADPEIEAVYNPLPNHLHVPLSLQAMEAGKAVLCEKPISLTAEEAQQLVEAQDRTGILVAEAFMVRHHPQWQRTRELVRAGAIGDLRAIQCAFSYFNADPDNVRNKADIGGGALYDIGVYPIVFARYLFGSEPRRALGLIDRDPQFGTDRLTSGMLDFEGGQMTFICSTQMAPYQRFQAFGTKGRIDVLIPVNALPGQENKILVDDGAQPGDASAKVESFPITNQYALQGEAFGRCLREGRAPEFPVEDAVLNMRVVDALFRSAAEDRWVDV